ncbi:hypothetical protein H4R26_002849 [Coemansia thaxteri]|uniref:U2A'/phosphoprotein 32 family A C-terminal domain-containing protein n=1 Tax=Coemansia thaxteri TaxID=2663907 RepID=A0A9W8BI15_9FUNG|nr:hypothetical protein H4R26_002849 [Coemansia thaxteri]
MRLSNETLKSVLDKPPSAVAAIDVRGLGITHVDDISDYAPVRRLDLSGNKIGQSEDLSGLRQLTALAHVNLSNNELQDMDVVERLGNLGVLNMSNNKISHISKHIVNCKQLKAIILGHNSIKHVKHIDTLDKLNTLVISHNRVESIPSMPKLKELTKISAAHNEIQTIPDLSIYPLLKEVRLNDNKIKVVPENIRSCTSLKVVDLGNNHMDEWTSIAPLGSLVYLDNLNLKGNPICLEAGYRERVVKMIPSLRVLDGERFDERFLKRREKRKLKESNEAGGVGNVKSKSDIGRKSDRSKSPDTS